MGFLARLVEHRRLTIDLQELKSEMNPFCNASSCNVHICIHCSRPVRSHQKYHVTDHYVCMISRFFLMVSPEFWWWNTVKPCENFMFDGSTIFKGALLTVASPSWSMERPFPRYDPGLARLESGHLHGGCAEGGCEIQIQTAVSLGGCQLPYGQ